MKAPSKILVIRSEISELRTVENFVKEIFKEYDLAQKEFNKVFLCISEAVINSIKHGNKNNRDKDVFIEIKCRNNYLEILIKDEGDGFNPDSVGDPTTKLNIKKESGRGIHIIKSLTDEMEFNKAGNCVQFKIECQ